MVQNTTNITVRRKFSLSNLLIVDLFYNKILINVKNIYIFLYSLEFNSGVVELPREEGREIKLSLGFLLQTSISNCRSSTLG